MVNGLISLSKKVLNLKLKHSKNSMSNIYNQTTYDLNNYQGNVDLYPTSTLIDVFSILGLCTIFVLYSAPIIDIVKIAKTRKTKSYPYIYLLVNSLASFFYVVYGIKRKANAIIIPNTYGFIVFLIYTYIFVFCIKKLNLIIKICIVFSITTIYLLLSFVFLMNKLIFINYYYFGFSGALFTTIANILTIFKGRKAIKNDNKNYVPIKIILIMFVNCCVWLTYSVLVGLDFFIFVPNTTGAVMSFIDIFIYLLIDLRNTKEEIAKEKEKEKENIESSNSLSNDYEINNKSGDNLLK